MADSIEIRAHLIRMHVEPARSRGDYTVTIRAGDVVNELASGTATPFRKRKGANGRTLSQEATMPNPRLPSSTTQGQVTQAPEYC